MKKSKWLRRAFSAVCCLSVFFTAACGGEKQSASESVSDSSSSVEETTSETKVWTAYGTEKILQDVEYSDRYDNKVLEIGVFRNEYESAQIIITPSESASYTVEMSDLKTSDGKNTLSKDAFTLYHEKYIKVETIKDPLSPTGMGMYPDALLPYEKALEYKENKLSADGGNQGVWVTVKPSKEQAAGTYLGTFKVNYGEQVFDVPVAVTVYDYTLSDDVYSKSSFGWYAADIDTMELDSSLEMYEAYSEFFLDYRVSATLPTSNDRYPDESLYIEYALERAKDPRCSTIALRWTGGSWFYAEVDENNGYIINEEDKGKEGNGTAYIQSIDFVQLEETCKLLAERGMEENIDIFKKMSMYCSMFDEYVAGTSGEVEAAYNLIEMDKLFHKIGDWILEEYSDENAALAEQMSTSVRGIRNVTTTVYLTDYMNENDIKMSFCPGISAYAASGNRAAISEYTSRVGSEMWAYGAGNPKTPFPSYHIEDVLISSRLYSWMMYNYNIVGNLYWTSALSRHTGGAELQVQDYYTTPLRDLSANGDGFLVYPGRPYGIFGPVGTIRLDSVRDGNEDYDLLHALEAYYTERGLTEADFDSIFEYLVNGLYSGTLCQINSDLCGMFTSTRTTLAALLELAANTGTVVENCKTESGVVKFNISAPAGVQLKNGGKLLSGTEKDGFLRYVVEVSLENEENKLELEATKDGKTYNLTLTLGGKVSAHNGMKNIPTDRVKGVRATAFAEGILAADNGLNEDILKITLQPDGITGNPAVDIDVGSLGAREVYYKSVTFRVYKFGAGTIDADVMGKAQGGRAFISVGKQTLFEGWNEITINLSIFNTEWYMRYLRLSFTNTPPDAGNEAVVPPVTEPVIIGIGDIYLGE